MQAAASAVMRSPAIATGTAGGQLTEASASYLASPLPTERLSYALFCALTLDFDAF